MRQIFIVNNQRVYCTALKSGKGVKVKALGELKVVVKEEKEEEQEEKEKEEELSTVHIARAQGRDPEPDTRNSILDSGPVVA